MRDSFVFYRSFKDSLKDLSDTDKLTMYEAISDYSLDMVEPQLSGFPKALFTLIRPILDANIQRWRNGRKGGEFGKLGGNPNFAKGKPNPYYQDNPKDNPTNNPDITPRITPNKDKDKEENKDKDINVKGGVGGAAKAATIAQRKQKFRDSLNDFIPKYGQSMIDSFFDYWSEFNRSQTKMRCELEKTFEVGKRLATWAKRDKDYSRRKESTGMEVGRVLHEDEDKDYKKGLWT